MPIPLPVTLKIDLQVLLQRVPALDQVNSGRCSWDQFGATVSRAPSGNIAKFRLIQDDANKPVFQSKWGTAKQIVHAILPSPDHPRGRIANRFSNLLGASTPVLLSDLSLWLAGEMKISVTTTRPMVAAMLYAIHQAAGNPDAILVS